MKLSQVVQNIDIIIIIKKFRNDVIISKWWHFLIFFLIFVNFGTLLWVRILPPEKTGKYVKITFYYLLENQNRTKKRNFIWKLVPKNKKNHYFDDAILELSLPFY